MGSTDLDWFHSIVQGYLFYQEDNYGPYASPKAVSKSRSGLGMPNCFDIEGFETKGLPEK